MNSIFEWLSKALSENAGIALLAASGWGLASVALSPCHLASVPLAVAFLRRDGRGSTIGTSLSLALGVLASLAGVGAITLAAGRIAGDLWGLGPWIASGALLVAGLYLLNVLSLPSNFTLHPDRIPRNSFGALLLGLLLGVTLGPCTFAFFAPIFAAAFGAAKSDLALSTGLVSAFIVGHTLAITVAGVLGLKLSGWIRHGGIATARLRAVAGIVLLASSVYVIATTP